MREDKADAADLPRKLIALRVGGQEFCVDIMSVREIRGWTPATPLPQSLSYVRGVINLRGVVLTIVDLADRLGFPAVEPTSSHVIMVAHVGDQPVGLLVDAVSDILSVSADQIQPTPNVGSELASVFVRGVVAHEGRMISMIALDEILSADVARAA